MVRACVILALLLVAATPVHGQDPLDPGNPTNFVVDWDFRIDEPVVQVDINGNGFVNILVMDQSRDGTSGVPGAPPAAGLPHEFSFTISPIVPDPGWSFGIPPPVSLRGGQEAIAQVPFSVIGATRIETFLANVTIRFHPLQAGDSDERSAIIGARTPGLLNFLATVKDTPQLGPREHATVRIDIQNLGLFETSYDMEVVENTCNMPVTVPHDTYAGPKQTTTAVVEFTSPWKDKLWYLSENCGLGIKIYPQGQEDIVSSVAQISVQVNGQSVMHVEKLAPAFVFLAALLLVILFILGRKARIEEELLGKPQKPWTIPVEALYLRVLRQKDERAWYVVRHHLMEEEYRSALLWYKSYKKGTRGTRKKETLVLRQEHKYERWKAKWAKAIAKPLKVADRFEAKLQRKLDRKALKLDRKDARKVRKVTKKMSAAHGKQVERALEKWQKQVNKANKKGLEAPPRPVLPEPDYPEEPEPRSFVLAEHKWSKKAARFRARRVREQGNLEVKFEKADARHLAKLRRKVQRLARKLDDPDFVAEHPLLRAES